jgi:hypothetical protein
MAICTIRKSSIIPIEWEDRSAGICNPRPVAAASRRPLPTRSQGLTDRSKATGDRTSSLLPFPLDVFGARGVRVEHHPIACILTAKGCRLRRRVGMGGAGVSGRSTRPRYRTADRRKNPPGWASEKRNLLSGFFFPLKETSINGQGKADLGCRDLQFFGR